MNIVTLSDGLVANILGNINAMNTFPELKGYADTVKNTTNVARKGCGCKRSPNAASVLSSARQTISAMSDDRIKQLKEVVGISGSIRILYRDGAKIRVRLV
mgnify:CR=1 FL=1